MKADAVFQGGGVKGIGFAGVICRFEEAGFTWERLAGTSAGAIAASLLAVGYKGKEFKDIILNLNYLDLLHKSKLQSIPLLGKPLGIFGEKSFYLGDNIEKWLNKLFIAKGKTKFKDISINGNSKLKIIASDITRHEMIILPDDLKLYGINPMEFEIARAVRMSISIPLYFDPIVLNHNNQKNFIVDGGVFSNFPIWIFDVSGIPRWPTFGFKFERDATLKNKGNSFFSYALDLIESIIDNIDETHFIDSNRVRTISIPTVGVKTTEFDITKAKSLNIFNSGYKSGDEFLKSWNFEQYIKNYRIKVKRICG